MKKFSKKTLDSLKKVLTYKNEKLLSIFIERLGLTETEAQQLFSDTLKFLFLCSATDEPLAPPKKIDEGWHYFILCTEDYEIFCKEKLGVFVHHRPAVNGKVEGTTGDLETLHYLTLAKVQKLNKFMKEEKLSGNFTSGIDSQEWCCHSRTENSLNFQSGVDTKEWCNSGGTKKLIPLS